MKPNSFLSAFFGLAFLAALAFAAYSVLRFGAGLFDGVPHAVAVVTAAAALALLLAASIVANGLRAVARRDDLRQQRAAAYAAFLHPGGGAAEPYVDPARESGAELQFLLHASPAVIAAVVRLRRAEAAGGTGLEEMAQLICAMRRDLGVRGRDLGVAELGELVPPVGERV
jgi:hypothetical protein